MRTFSRGSAEAMLYAFETRLSELESERNVEGATNTCGIAVNPEVIISAAEGEVDNDYVADLLNDVLDAVSKELSQTGQEIADDEALLSVVTADNNVIEFTIPFADLTHDREADYQLILEAVQDGLKDTEKYETLPEEEESVEGKRYIPTDDYLNDHW